jgi:hypothetical protein
MAVGTSAAAAAALYIANRGWRGAAAERRDARWEHNVLELGELLTTVLDRHAYDAAGARQISRPAAA